jgi:MoaA/NifB/PqqE/SkfB family radical SAM enzyme
MQVKVSTRCNFTCFYCAGRDMSYEAFCDLLDHHVARYGVPPLVSLQGEGEPTINPDFFRMAERVKAIGSTPYTITNGTFKQWRKFVPLFPAVGVSMDTLDDQEAEKIGRFNLPRVQEFIENLARHSTVVVHTVSVWPKSARAVGLWCRERGLHHIVQPLQNKPDYQYRYPQFVPKQTREERFACGYLREDRMRYYDMDGTAMPCAFIKDTSQYPGLAQMHRLHEEGSRPACCAGCLMNG